MKLVCSSCKIEKNEEEFSIHRKRKTGRQPECKLCKKNREFKNNESGMCCKHKNNPVVPGMKHCQKCLDVMKISKEKNNINGMCGSHKDRCVVPGTKSCQECLNSHKETRKENKQNGKCIGHKDRLAVLGKTRCLECLIINSFYAAKRIAKKKGYLPPNITLPEMIIKYAQNRTCSVSGCTNDDLCLDHCHLTGTVRGWLCIKHNTALGNCNDRPEDLYALIEYLRIHGIKSN